MVLTSQLFAREVVNGILAVIVTCIVCMTLFRLGWDRYHHRLKFGDFLMRPEVRVSIALSVLFGGEALQRFWVFVLLRRSINGQSIAWMESYYIIPLLASLVVSIGGLCLIRVLAPLGTGRVAVFCTLCVCAGFLAVAL